MKKLIGPFAQLLPFTGLAARGPLKDEDLAIITDAGILIENGLISAVGPFDHLKSSSDEIEEVESEQVVLPGFIDAHTHICFGGSRARDFAARNNGKTYQEIAKAGGGIWDTVTKTREASADELLASTLGRMNELAINGVTTVEVKSGYGLSVESELKMLRTIESAGAQHPVDVVSTCLAAHIIPKEFERAEEYLKAVLHELVPKIQAEALTTRFDIFVEENAYDPDIARYYLSELKALGFELTIHGDQFTTGGSQVAIDCGAISVDHLEASGDEEIQALAKSDVIPTALPGASIGLGVAFTPARKLLDAGCSLAIASDWNPGSAPHGYLLNQASILGTYEKLSAAEVLSGMTFRAARALKLSDRGKLETEMLADFAAFPTNDFREILYLMGEMRPASTWKNGERL